MDSLRKMIPLRQTACPTCGEKYGTPQRVDYRYACGSWMHNLGALHG